MIITPPSGRGLVIPIFSGGFHYPAARTVSSNTHFFPCFFYPAVRTGSSNTHFFNYPAVRTGLVIPVFFFEGGGGGWSLAPDLRASLGHSAKQILVAPFSLHRLGLVS